MKTQNRGFTLVELIVVVTILAILGTIGFVSYSSYLTSVRDANRTASLQAISDGLVAHSTKWALPIPDQASSIFRGSVGTGTIVYQWQSGVTVLETIDYSKAWEDPTDKVPFGYVLDVKRKYHQLVAFAEESDTSVAYNMLFPQANAIDYSLRYPLFYGDKLGVFLDESTLEPLDVSDGATIDVASMSGFDLHYDPDTILTSVSDVNAYANTVLVWGLVSSCSVLNAKKALTATGSYYVGTGTVASCWEGS